MSSPIPETPRRIAISSSNVVLTGRPSKVRANSIHACFLTAPRRIAALWLWLAVMGLMVVTAQKGVAQSITLAPPTSSTTYVDTLSVSYSITGDSSAQAVKVFWTYTSGNQAPIGSVWTLTMKTASLSQTFTLKPTDLTNAANAFNASPTSAMPEGFYSVYAQYTRPVSAGSLLVSTTTRTNVYLDTGTQTPAFSYAWPVTINTTTDVVTWAGHGLANDTPVTVSGTNLTSTTTYYVSVIDSGSFKLANSPGGSSFVDFTTATSPAVTTTLASNSYFPGTTARLQYKFAEFYLSGSAMLKFTGPTTVTINLVDNVLNGQFTIDRTSISNATYIQSSSPTTLPDGSYTVTLSYQDRYSHAVASAVLNNVTFDSGTQTPSFDNLVNNAAVVHGTAIPYTLPETPLAGSVSLTFSNGSVTKVIPLTNATSATFTYDRSLYAATIPTGVYTVTLSYQDAAGNPAATTSVTGVAVTVAAITNTEDSDGDGLSDAAEIELASLGFDWQVAQPAMVSTFLSNTKLYTQAQVDAARTAGQADVTSSPATYNLYTLAQRDAARTAGQADVTGNPSAYSLYTLAERDAARTSGQSDVTSNPSAYNLYTLSDLQNLQVGTPIITKDTVTGKWKITIELQKSTDLTNYTRLPFVSAETSVNGSGQLEFLFTVPETNAFFRLSTF